ncbi:YaaC family protein [Mycobacterium sp. LTG2003]
MGHSMPLPFGRPHDARDGTSISVTGRPVVAGIGSHPRYLSPRASSADLWSSVEAAATADGLTRLGKLHAATHNRSAGRRLVAYVHQARQYYDVIASLDPATKPLPAYYFALNLTKAYLTLVAPPATAPAKVSHGASDSSTPGQRYRFTQEHAKVSQNGVLRMLAARTGQGFCWPSGARIQISRLAAYLVESADLYSDAFGTKPKLVPVAATEVRSAGAARSRIAWLTVDISRMVLEERGLTARSMLGQAAIFASRFQLVHDSANADTYTFESNTAISYSRVADVLVPTRQEFDRSLLLRDRTTKGGIDHVVLSSHPALLSQEGVTFILLHHLSNMVRYRPQQVEALRGSSYWWLFTSWVDRACENFLLSIASRMSLDEHLIL